MRKSLSKVFSVSSNSFVGELSLAYHSKVKASDRPQIIRSSDAYDIFLKTWDDGKIELQEEFKVLLLNRKNACLGISTISSGGKDACFVDLKLLFAIALLGNASSMIVSHNHPSGHLQPSAADIAITKRIIDVGHKLDLILIDHLIVAKDGYLSLADEGLVDTSRPTPTGPF